MMAIQVTSLGAVLEEHDGRVAANAELGAGSVVESAVHLDGVR